MTRIRLLVMSWICLSLGVGIFLLELPARSHAAGGASRVLVAADQAVVVYDPVTTLMNIQTDPTPTPFSNPTATPSSQSGHGRNIFHLFCMPCHGDRGQGLTEEFRLREYPPEDTNCWESGCHGARPYENGFTLPKAIPALIGADALKRFADGQMMYDYIHKSMPFNAPGSLTTDQYLQLTAFLLEQNNLLAEDSRLDLAALRQIAVRPAATPIVPLPQTSTDNSSWLLIGAVIFGSLVFVAYLIKRSRSAAASR